MKRPTKKRLVTKKAPRGLARDEAVFRAYITSLHTGVAHAYDECREAGPLRGAAVTAAAFCVFHTLTKIFGDELKRHERGLYDAALLTADSLSIETHVVPVHE